MSQFRLRFAAWFVRLALVLVTLMATPALAQPASTSPPFGSTLPLAAASQPYSTSLTGVGGLPPYEFRSLGGMPAGLSLGLRGELSGTLEAVGSHTLTVGFMDANGRETTGTYRLVVVVPTSVVEGSFGARTRDFVTTRQQLLARSIDLPGLRDRLRPAGARGLAGQGDGSAQALSFAASLADLRNDAGAAAASLASGVAAPPPFDVWIDGLAGWQAGGDAGSGSFGATGVGADYLVNDRLLLGLALYRDRMSAGNGGGETSGSGVLAGPYASIGLGEAATLDLSLLYGRSSNDISSRLFGATYAGSFETSRWLAHARLEGLWRTDVLTIRPRAELSLSHEEAEAYAVTGPMGDEVTIDGFGSTLFAASLGADLETTHDLGNGLVLQPMLGLEVGIANTVPSAGLRAGFELTGSDAWDVSAGIAAGLDGNGLGSVAVRGGLGVRF